MGQLQCQKTYICCIQKNITSENKSAGNKRVKNNWRIYFGAPGLLELEVYNGKYFEM